MSYTHRVTVTRNTETYKTDLAATEATMSGYVAGGSWTQAEADRNIDLAKADLAEAEEGARVIYSQHKSATGAARGLRDATSDRRYLDPQIETT